MRRGCQGIAVGSTRRQQRIPRNMSHGLRRPLNGVLDLRRVDGERGAMPRLRTADDEKRAEPRLRKAHGSARIIRSLPARPERPIIAMSAKTFAEDRRACRLPG